jgi:hypothetical protein
MANAMSSYLAGKIINHILRGIPYTPPTNVYLALYSADIVEGVTETELTGYNYDRVQCSTFVPSGFNTFWTQSQIIFPTASNDWLPALAWAIKDAPTGGNILYYGSMTPTIQCHSGKYLKIDGYGGLTIKHLQYTNISGGWTYIMNPTIINHVLNNDNYDTGNEATIALGRNVTLDADSNFSTWTEISGYNYARQNIHGSSLWTAPDATTGSSVNVNDINFTNFTPGDWGTISDVLIFDGNDQYVLWGHLSTPITLQAGMGFKFSNGAVKINLQ